LSRRAGAGGGVFLGELIASAVLGRRDGRIEGRSPGGAAAVEECKWALLRVAAAVCGRVGLSSR
jgi:hypothetical protein